MKKKIVVFTGAGISQESGVSTFRDIKDGLWYNYDVDDVATLQGWKNDRETVLEFRNMLCHKINEVSPNKAHTDLAQLEKDFDVTIVTQNVDDLHERGGSSNIIHIHGELLKANSSLDRSIVYDYPGDINIGDKCEKGSQLKPNYVLFGEYPYRLEEVYEKLSEADYVIAVGTGFNIPYTVDFLTCLKKDCKVYYIDTDPVFLDEFNNIDIKIVIEKATVGVAETIERIKKL